MSTLEPGKAIASRAEELDAGVDDCLDPKHVQGCQYWNQGVAAFRADTHLEDCPFVRGAEQDDWLRGWMAAELIEFGRFDDEAESGRGSVYRQQQSNPISFVESRLPGDK